MWHPIALHTPVCMKQCKQARAVIELVSRFGQVLSGPGLSHMYCTQSRSSFLQRPQVKLGCLWCIQYQIRSRACMKRARPHSRV
jgi:hypothetical protein